MSKNYKRKKQNIDDGYEPKGNPEHLAKSIDELALSEKTHNALIAGGINTVVDLARRRVSEMYRIQNIGRKNCIEISKKLAPLGISFREEVPQADKADVKNVPKVEQNLGNKTEKIKKFDSKQENRRENRNDRPDKKVQRPVQQQGKQKNGKNPVDNVNRGLNDSLTRQYAGMTINEIIMGKRQRPPRVMPEREKLTADSIVKFYRKGKWGYKDWKGNVLIQPQFDEAFAFSEGLACVEKDEKLGYIDMTGNIVIDYKYDCASSFRNGKAVVVVDEKCGYIDKEGNFVIEPTFDIATPFEDGRAIVRAEGRWGVLTEDDKILWR